MDCDSEYIMFSLAPCTLQPRDEKKYERLREFTHWMMNVMSFFRRMMQQQCLPKTSSLFPIMLKCFNSLKKSKHSNYEL